MVFSSKVCPLTPAPPPDFSSSDIATLQRAKIVPVGDQLVEPTACFFQADSALPPGLKSLFLTVPDFGLAARPFLVGVGVKETPSTSEIASMVIADPERFLDLSGSSDRYLSGTFHGSYARCSS